MSSVNIFKRKLDTWIWSLENRCGWDTWVGDYEHTGSSEIIGCLGKVWFEKKEMKGASRGKSTVKGEWEGMIKAGRDKMKNVSFLNLKKVIFKKTGI